MGPSLFIVSVLLGGFVFGAIARLVVPRAEVLTWAETTLVGIAGSAVGATLVNAVTPGAPTLELRLASAIGGVVGTLAVLTLVVVAVDRLGLRPTEAPRATAAALVAGGETHEVEFKSTARRNTHTRERDPRIELAIAKTVAGFLNADGGTLLVGVTDDGETVGLDDDLALMKQPDLDRYELWLSDHLGRCLGRTAVAHVRVGFEVVDHRTVCRVDVAPSPEPVFLDTPGGAREADMYVRLGNSTRKLLTDDALAYSRTRWS